MKRRLADDPAGRASSAPWVHRAFNRAFTGALACAFAFGAAACSSATASPSASSTTLSASARAEKTAVLKAWENAENAFFDYSAAGPPPGFHADLTEITPSDIAYVPKLARYESGSALITDVAILMADWSYGVVGPTSYDLGHPSVEIVSSTKAQVTTCVTSTGWTEPTFPPPKGISGWPANGGSLVRHQMILNFGNWYITREQYRKGVNSC